MYLSELGQIRSSPYKSDVKTNHVLPQKYLSGARNTSTKNAGGDKSCWKMATQFIFLYMENSSIHGFAHLTSSNRHWLEYLMWLSVISMGIVGSVYLSLQSLRRYDKDPTVIAFERDYKNWYTPLPAGIICSDDKINQTNLESYLKKYPVQKRDEIKDFVEVLMYTTYDTLKDMKPVKPHVPSDQYMKLIEQLSFNFTLIGRDTLWDTYYTKTISELGICNAYNSEIAAYSWPKFFFSHMSTPIKLKGKPDLKKGKPNAGYLDYTVKRMNSQAKAFFVGSNEIPEITIKHIPCKFGDFTFFEFTAQCTTCPANVRSLTFQQRKCRFMDESNLETSPVYSYNLCRMNCRWKLAQKLCQCAPHFYKKVDNVKTCDIEGLRCLANHSDLLIELRYPVTDEKVQCDCLPTCENNNYFLDSYHRIEWYNSTNAEWSIKTYPRMRFRRELIFGFSDLLISVGGVAGLCLGCSVLSFIELFYFFTLRLYFHIVDGKNSKPGKN